MKKGILAVIFILVSSVNCFALTDDMICKSGNCDQWKGWYERSGDNITFHFENISGKPLFKIKATIRYFDYMGEYLGQHFAKLEGPIHQYFTPRFRVHPKTDKIEYDINCAEEYEGAQPAIQSN